MRYYQLVASGRQLALFVVAVAGLLLLSFFVGLSLGLAEKQERLKSAAPVATKVVAPATPTVVEPPPTTPTPPVNPTPQLPPPEPAAVLTPEVTPTPMLMVTPGPAPRPSPVERSVPLGVWVQVGAFKSKADAEGVRLRVVALGFRPEQVKVLALASGKYRVRVGPFPDKESGSRVVARLREGGFREAFMVSE